MDPFASNVGFLLLDCVEEPMERIMLLHQERPVKLPKCDREDCDWQKFKEIYAVRYFIFLCANTKIGLRVAKSFQRYIMLFYL